MTNNTVNRKSLHFAGCLFMLIILFSFCGRKKESGTRIFIDGKIDNLNKAWIRISEIESRQIVVIDSVKTGGEGDFSIEFPASEHGFYNISFPDRSMITIIAGPGEKINIRAKASDIELSYRINGSGDSEILREFIQYTIINERKVDSLGKIFENNRNSPDFHVIRGLLEQSFTRIYIDQQQFTKSFILEHPGSLASIIALHYQLSNNKILDMAENIELYELVETSLARDYSSNKHYLQLRKSLNDIRESIMQREIAEKHTSPGMTIPGFKLTDIHGNRVRIEDFRDQPLVIYFWASWDARSRQMNRRFKNTIDSFDPHKIQVFAISLDNNPELWKAAIRIDSLTWHHASDLLGMSSPVLTLLNIPDKLPYFYLVDPHGIIVYKGNDPDMLEKEISDMLSLN